MRWARPWGFPLGVLGLYALGFMFAPEKAYLAFHLSRSLFQHLLWPLGLALAMMMLLNRFLSPALVSRFLGQGSGLRGAFLSSVAGILSMGPIYAWYPLLKTMKNKGSSTFHMAHFIGCRAVKPALLPVLAAYWGWRFATIFVITSLLAALIIAGIVHLLCPSTGHGSP